MLFLYAKDSPTFHSLGLAVLIEVEVAWGLMAEGEQYQHQHGRNSHNSWFKEKNIHGIRNLFSFKILQHAEFQLLNHHSYSNERHTPAQLVVKLSPVYQDPSIVKGNKIFTG